MIDMRQVSKSFGAIRAVRGVTFEVHTGQCVGLLGPNGAGKSTTLRMVTGFIPPSSGSIRIGGHDTVGDSIQARRLIGYLPESNPLYPEMRAGDFLAYRARLYGLARRERRAAVERALDLCRITGVRGRRIGHLSKGYRQRVGLASTLLHNPPVLILDEPTNGLDPSQIRETRSLIKDLAQNRTVLVSSHILPEVEKTCDRVIVIAGGTVRADGSPEELVRRLDHAAAYVLEVQADSGSVAAFAARLRALPGVAGVATVEGFRDSGWARLSITARADAADLREGLGRAASAAGVVVRELTRVVPTLEHVFVRLTESDAGPRETAGERSAA